MHVALSMSSTTVFVHCAVSVRRCQYHHKCFAARMHAMSTHNRHPGSRLRNEKSLSIIDITWYWVRLILLFATATTWLQTNPPSFIVKSTPHFVVAHFESIFYPGALALEETNNARELLVFHTASKEHIVRCDVRNQNECEAACEICC